MTTEDKIRQEYLSCVRSTQQLLSSMTAEERAREIRPFVNARYYVESTARHYVAVSYGNDALRVLSAA